MKMTGLPFSTINHVGVVVRDIEKFIETYEALGIGPWKRQRLPGPNFKFIQREHFGKPIDDVVYEVANAKVGPIELEVFECISGDSIPKRFIDSKGEGVWHYGFEANKEDYDKALAVMAEKGFKIIGSTTLTNGLRMAFFDTDKMGGVIFQLHEI
jgi:methylmalonyl-CoA/ethylmalonyl-CoA epimerase